MKVKTEAELAQEMQEYEQRLQQTLLLLAERGMLREFCVSRRIRKALLPNGWMMMKIAGVWWFTKP